MNRGQLLSTLAEVRAELARHEDQPENFKLWATLGLMRELVALADEALAAKMGVAIGPDVKIMLDGEVGFHLSHVSKLWRSSLLEMRHELREPPCYKTDGTRVAGSRGMRVVLELELEPEYKAEIPF